MWHFRIPQAVPLNGSISFHDIAKAVNANEALLTRFIRHAMGIHIFIEPEPGMVAHTIDSRLLAEDEYLFHLVGCLLQDINSGYQKTIEAMEKWPNSEEPNHAGCALAWETDLPFYDYLTQHPDIFRRFAGMLTYVGKNEAVAKKNIIDAYSWQDYPENSTVVDVGGGNGQVSVTLALANPSLRFIVQDLSGGFKDADSIVPSELKPRVSFMEHDFRTPQPVKNAEAFIFCQVIHNWSDTYVVDIMKQLLPAMRKGVKVLIIDRCMPDDESHTLRDVEKRELRTVDLLVNAICNSRDRSVNEIRSIFQSADKRFKYRKTYRAEGSPFIVCEHIWDE